jgi:hypothetical protein
MSTVEAEERSLTSRVLRGISTFNGVEVFGVRDADPPNMVSRGGIIAFSVRSKPHNRVARELAERSGIGARTGCHCAHLLVKQVLHIPPCRAKAADLSLRLFPTFTSNALPGLVRISLGIGNDETDVDIFLQTLRDIAEAKRSWADRFWAKTYNGAPFLGRSRVQAQVKRRIQALVGEVYLQQYPHCEINAPSDFTVLGAIGAEAKPSSLSIYSVGQ